MRIFLSICFCLLLCCASYATKADSLLRATSKLIPPLKNTDTSFAVSMNILSQKYRKSGNLDTAILLAERANYIAKYFISDPIYKLHLLGIREHAVALNNLGLIETEKTNFAVAVNFLLESIKIREQMGDSIGMAVAYHNIGIVHANTGNPDKAIEYYEKALIINEKLGQQLNMSKNLNNIGQIYLEKRTFSKAKTYFQRALDIKLKLNDITGIAYAYNNFGSISSMKGEHEDALIWFTKGLETSRKQKTQSIIVTSLANLATSFYKVKKFKEALPLIEEAYQLGRKIDSKNHLTEILITWAKLDSAAGKFKDAYFHNLEYMRLNDSVKNEEGTRKVLQQQLQYEYNQKVALGKIEQEKKDALTQQQMNAQKTQRNYLIAGLSIMLLLIIFVYKNYRDKKNANHELKFKNAIIEEKQKEILDSIRYAKRIQNALMANEKYIEKSLKNLKN